MLADPGVDDALGREPVDGPDRLPVVPEFGVVVVLEDQPVAAGSPRLERGPALRRHDRSGGEVVRGRDDDRVRGGPCQRLHDEPVVVDRDRIDHETGPLGGPDRVALARVLDGDPSRSVGPQDLGHKAEGLGEPVADDDPLGVGGGAAHAVEIRRQRVPELRGAAVVEVAEAVARRLVEDPPQGPEPGLPGELGDVGSTVEEVDPRRRRHHPDDRGRRDVGHRRADPRRAARTARQVALGDELLVGLDDDAARDAELVGQGTGRRQGRRRRQSARPDRLAQAMLELAMEGPRIVAAERNEELVRPTGPDS